MVAGQDVLTARTGSLQPSRARRGRGGRSSWLQVRAKFEGRKKADTELPEAPERASATTYGGPGSSRGGFPAISGPVQKVSANPYSNPTTFLPLFAFSALGAQGRAERARVVLGSSKCRARDELSCLATLQKVSPNPYSNLTTFLPLFAFSALGAQGRSERARVVLGSSGAALGASGRGSRDAGATRVRVGLGLGFEFWLGLECRAGGVGAGGWG